MQRLNQLSWVGEHDYDMGGARFALRSTSEPFLGKAAHILGGYRIHSNEAVWPVLSVVAPSGSPGLRGFYLGYLNSEELFRYADEESALGALLAGIDGIGRAQLRQSCVFLDAMAIEVGGQAILVYGEEAARWAAGLTIPGTTVFEPPTMLDPTTNRLVAWPLRITERPTTLDRRGVRLAPLARLLEPSTPATVAVTAVVRASAERATAPAQVVAELMGRADTTGRGRSVFRSMARVLSCASLIADEAEMHHLLSHLHDGANHQHAHPQPASRP